MNWFSLYMYNTDLLEILGIMAKLGVKDERMQDAVDIVLSKQRRAWPMEPGFHLQ